MVDLGREVGKALPPNSILALHGDLGAGKTTFSGGVAEGLGIQDPIQSPTFVFMNQYEGRLSLFHFDLYRMSGVDDFLGLGFDEFLSGGGVSLIEWPERIIPLLEKNVWHIYFSYEGEGRKVVFSKEF